MFYRCSDFDFYAALKLFFYGLEKLKLLMSSTATHQHVLISLDHVAQPRVFAGQPLHLFQPLRRLPCGYAASAHRASTSLPQAAQGAKEPPAVRVSACHHGLNKATDWDNQGVCYNGTVTWIADGGTRSLLESSGLRLCSLLRAHLS